MSENREIGAWFDLQKEVVEAAATLFQLKRGRVVRGRP